MILDCFESSSFPFLTLIILPLFSFPPLSFYYLFFSNPIILWVQFRISSSLGLNPRLVKLSISSCSSAGVFSYWFSLSSGVSKSHICPISLSSSINVRVSGIIYILLFLIWSFFFLRIFLLLMFFLVRYHIPFEPSFGCLCHTPLLSASSDTSSSLVFLLSSMLSL